MFESLLNHASNGFVHTTLVAKLVILLVMTQLTILSVTLYLHRSQSHRSVEFHPALAHAFRFWCWLTTAISADAPSSMTYSSDTIEVVGK